MTPIVHIVPGAAIRKFFLNGAVVSRPVHRPPPNGSVAVARCADAIFRGKRIGSGPSRTVLKDRRRPGGRKRHEMAAGGGDSRIVAAGAFGLRRAPGKATLELALRACRGACRG